ncbi:TPA: transcriptional repressor [Pseudomonas aeruginosa]|nr:transcriptional repressor [Pseudomonas aeruginosa]HCF1774321.1 transcriptional repressor [Pseudomonas aeruginosa]HCF6827491.1 transcriptional repressor [Pseudomonas aeruginosa]HCR1180525.1 transcriptional repressor [Pseudomonas aeruginosa]
MQLTPHQQRVLTTLRHASEPLSAYALLDRLRDEGFKAPMQVYRALERLAEQGLVHRLETLNAYVSCAHAAGCRHGFTAFAICDDCGHVDEFTDKDLSHCLTRWMKNNAFSLRSSTIEFYGKCTNCGGPGPAGRN